MKLLSAFCSFLFLFVIFPHCSKYNQLDVQHATTKTKDKLLTEKSWKLASYGYDLNNNDVVDLTENAITSCQKDNFYTFSPNGSGVVQENKEICPGKNATTSFQWKFINDETGLDFVSGITQIIKINEDSLILGDNNSFPDRLILTYKH